MSEESTLCALPSTRGDLDVDHGIAGGVVPRSIWARTPFSTDGMNCRGTDAADHLVDELEARALGQRLDLDVADRVLAVAAGLLDVAAVPPRRGRRTSRAAAPAGRPGRRRRRSGCAAGPAARRRAPRRSSTARAGGSRGCSRSAASGPRRPAVADPARACPRRPWRGPRPRPAAAGSGISHGRISSGSSLPRACRRSRPVTAWRSHRCRRRRRTTPVAGSCPAARSARRSARPRRGPRARGRRGKCPDTWTVWSGRSVPEKTRTRLIRPTYGVGGGLDDLGDQRPGRVAAEATHAVLPSTLVTSGHRVLDRGRERAGHDLEQLGRPEPGRGADRDHRVERALARRPARGRRSAPSGRSPRRRGSGPSGSRPRTPR